MKIFHNVQKPAFQPINITLTCESEQDLLRLLAMFNFSDDTVRKNFTSCKEHNKFLHTKTLETDYNFSHIYFDILEIAKDVLT